MKSSLAHNLIVFTEPSNVGDDTRTNLVPLQRLAGRWRSANWPVVNPKAERGRDASFGHQDRNMLCRVGAAMPNLWAVIRAARKRTAASVPSPPR